MEEAFFIARELLDEQEELVGYKIYFSLCCCSMLDDNAVKKYATVAAL